MADAIARSTASTDGPRSSDDAEGAVAASPPPSERLAELSSRARGHAGRARAAGTERAYAGDWTRFQLWCLDLDLCPLPAGPLTVALYLTHLAPAWRPATPEDPPEQVAAGELVATTARTQGSATGTPMTVSRWLL